MSGKDIYVTLHEKTKHNTLGINLRYEPKYWPRANFGNNFFTWIGREMIFVHEDLLCSTIFHEL